jgi:hypothetical protein
MGGGKRPGWELRFDPRVGFRCMDMGAVPDVCSDQPKMRSAFSVLCVLEKAVTLGARHIRLFGVDMGGSWDPLYPTEEECIERYKWDRWRHERETLDQMIAKAASLGICIEKVEKPE